MADEDKESAEPRELCTEKQEDVFLNGNENAEAEEDDTSQVNLDPNLPEQVLPRRSSLMNRDAASRRPQAQQRKKTVSFSSMPTERKIATGKKTNIYSSLSTSEQIVCLCLMSGSVLQCRI